LGVHPANDALRLLRVIDAHQALGCVSSIVLPSDAARAAGLEPGTGRYEEAVWRLLVEGALEVDGSVPPGVVARLHFGRAPYLLVPAAVRMLGRA
jgi:hypothetical protein